MFIPLLTFALATSLQINSAEADKGATLYASCKALLRIIDTTTAQASDGPPAQFCLGYFDGYIAGTNHFTRRVCLQGASRATVVRVYVGYMDRNPKLFDSPPNEGVYGALLDSYPCLK